MADPPMPLHTLTTQQSHNLAKTATTECTTLSLPIENNTTLMANVTSLTASMASLTTAYSILAAGHKPPTAAKAREPKQSFFAVNGYWHYSATCKDKANGHKEGATHANTMNGSNNSKGWDA